MVSTKRVYKMNLLLLPILITITSAAKIISTSSCRCWKGYQAEIENSSLQCVALDQFHVMPCNMPKLPKCECSGNGSNILKDESGTWCAKYIKGVEKKRWPCENTYEWDEFFRKHPMVV